MCRDPVILSFNTTESSRNVGHVSTRPGATAQAQPQRNSCHRQGTGISGDQQGGWQATTGSDQRSGGGESFLKAYTNEARRLSSHAKRAGKGTTGGK